MTKRSTKQQLLLSAISLLLCVSMLVGSTFAWFTDSVTSTNNIIKSGTLDVELYYQAEGQTDWTKVTSETNIFKDGALWEPGYTEVVKLKVVNEGNLALKYKLGVNVAKETPGTLEDKSTFMLSDYIKFGIVEGAQTYTRDQAIAAVKDTATPLNKAYASEVTELLPKDATNTDNEDIVTMVVYMPTTVGNEANYRGTQPVINLGLNLLATQVEYEEDSFDENYDKDSVYAEHFVTTADELTAAIAEGGVIALMNDLELADNTNIIIPDGVETTINLNGNDIVGTSTEIGKNRADFTVKGDLTVEGNGTVSHVHTGANMEWNNLTAPFSVEGGTLTLGEGVTVINNGGSDMAYAVDVNTTLGTTTLNVNGATLYSSYIGVRIFNNHKTEKGTVNFNSGIIQGDKNGYDIWAQLMSCPAENAVVNIADGINYTTADKSGTMYYIDAKETVVTSSAKLEDAIADGKEVVLVDDVEFKADITSDATIDLGGNALTMTNSDQTVSGSLAVSNGTVNTSNGYFDVRPVADDEEIVYENVTFNGTKKSLTYGNSTNRTSSALEFCPPAQGITANLVFKNCTFNDAQVIIEAMSGKEGAVTVLFDNCKFNNFGNADAIDISNYMTVDITIKDCDFNFIATSNINVIDALSSSTVNVTFEGENTVYAESAVPTTDSSLVGTVDEVKVFSTQSVKVASSAVDYVNGLDTVTVSGIAAK